MAVEILLVEDSEPDALLTKKALSQGRVVNVLHHVWDGEEAIDFLRQRGDHASAPRPRLILLDLNLPKKSGKEVLAEIKSDPELKRIPVVVLTTSRDEGDVLRSYDLHANSYMTKPVTFDKFHELILSLEEYWFVLSVKPPE
jgi:CheY-like chemotaxis protein